jgi:hypothetical protein
MVSSCGSTLDLQGEQMHLLRFLPMLLLYHVLEQKDSCSRQKYSFSHSKNRQNVNFLQRFIGLKQNLFMLFWTFSFIFSKMTVLSALTAFKNNDKIEPR